ncbi:hypothetical protein O181_025919 [Austropuccinia psidii MF-1]|uniref:Uncharacterized protein n=1 Tax=Austropuccinia psidii MF-1 TaxID=1389203 RepID=A0A9Q3H151_9BASI|nr:hypothetical protein [Austropuccinia psidii MF-1]
MYRPNLPPLRLALQLDNAGKRESHFSSRSCDSSSSSSRSTRPPHDLSIYSLSSSSPVASASFVNIHQSCYVDSYSQTSDCSSRWRNQTSIRNNAFESFKRPCHYEELNRICPIHNGGTSINSLQNSRSYDLRPSKTQHSSPADSEIILGNRPIDDQSKSFSLGEQSNGLREAGFAMEAPLRQTGPSSGATENIYRGDNQRRSPNALDTPDISRLTKQLQAFPTQHRKFDVGDTPPAIKSCLIFTARILRALPFCVLLCQEE